MRLTPPGGIMVLVSTRWRNVGWQGGASMSAEENMALARRFMEARVVKRDLNAVDEMLAPDFINHNKLVAGQEPDREDYLRGIAAFHAALSPGRLIIEDQVAGADKVVTRFIVHAIHDRGELTNRAIVVHRIVEGKIAEEWGMGTIGGTLRKRRLEQEIRERERIEQELQVARRGTRSGQRDVVGSHPLQHVRHVLLRHPRPQEWHLELRQRWP